MQSIASIINQSYKNRELIVVDDASSDDTITKIKQIKDNRIKIITNAINQERWYSRNVAMKVASGEYIAFCDDDDIRHTEKLTEQLKFMYDNNLDLCGTYIKEINERGDIIWKCHFTSLDKDIKNIINFTNQFCYSSVIIKKDVFKKYGWFSEDRKLSWVEDYEYWLRIIKNISVWNIPQELTYYRIRANNTTNSKNFTMNIHTLMVLYKYWNQYNNYYLWLLARFISLITPLSLRKKILKFHQR